LSSVGNRTRDRVIVRLEGREGNFEDSSWMTR